MMQPIRRVHSSESHYFDGDRQRRVIRMNESSIGDMHPVGSMERRPFMKDRHDGRMNYRLEDEDNEMIGTIRHFEDHGEEEVNRGISREGVSHEYEDENCERIECDENEERYEVYSRPFLIRQQVYSGVKWNDISGLT